MLERPAVPDDERNAEREDVHGQRLDATYLLDGGIRASERDGRADIAGNVQNHVTDAVRGDGDDEQKQCKHAFNPLW